MPIRSQSEVSFAKKTLPYPIFAADFDPYNRGYLVVGGGGGEGRSGVPNQISVLDVINRANLKTVVDIELSRDEDSVQSLASLSTRDGLIIFAGINSSEAAQNAGNNEHFRAFSAKYPPRKKQKTDEASQDEKGEWNVVGNRSLFKTSTASKKETYQRLMRLSPSQLRPSGSSRIGAVATGFAQESEIIVFDATTALPESADILTRIDLPETTEAVDLDINESDDNTFSLVYCTEYDLYEQTLEYDFETKKCEKTPKGPRRVHEIPPPAGTEDLKLRPKIRCLRFMNSQNVVALLNKPNRGGAELRVYHMYPTGPAILVQQKTLPRRVKQAVSMDVCALDADKNGNQQIMVAVAGQDISIEVYTVNFQAKTDTFSNFRSYLTFKDVHEHQMTKLCFSPYHSTIDKTNEKSSTETAGDSTKPPLKFVRLASVSMGNTVVVDTFTLLPLKPKDKKSRYILSHPNDEAWSLWTHIIVVSLIVMMFAYLVQSYFFPSKGSSGNSVLHPSPLPRRPSAQKAPEGTAVFRDMTSSEASPILAQPSERLHSLLSAHTVAHPSAIDPEASEQPALVLRPDADSTGVTLDVHPDKEALLQQEGDVKHWDELEEHQKAHWKDKLKEAGHWVEEEGETIFKGILFSEYAGMIGQAAADALRDL